MVKASGVQGGGGSALTASLSSLGIMKRISPLKSNIHLHQ